MHGPSHRSLGERLFAIVVVTSALNVILIAIPGFFSHDELDWMNLIRRGFHGWDLFLADYRHSPFFRPLGTVIISAALRLPLQPFASHAALVLLQSLSCCLLFFLVRLFRPDRAFAAALLFAVMPGTAYAAGWIAAFFDLQFTFFALGSLAAGVAFWRGGHRLWLAVSIAAFAAGLLCKEPAVTIPLAGLVLAFVDRTRAAPRRVAILGAAAAGVAVIYAALRLPALLHVGETGGGGYGFGSFAMVVKNAMAYFVFPFAPRLAEITTFSVRNWVGDLLPVAAHGLLLALLWIRYGKSAPVLYLLAFFLPLLPVLIISKFETQYTYATSVAISVALALVWQKSPVFAVPTIAVALILMFHSYIIQRTMYQTGVCQTRALATLQAVLPSAMRSGPPVVYGPDDTPWWVMARALFQNSFPVDGKDVSVAFAHQPAGATMQFLHDCSVVPVGGP
jgi:hypothetical protein